MYFPLRFTMEQTNLNTKCIRNPSIILRIALVSLHFGIKHKSISIAFHPISATHDEMA